MARGGGPSPLRWLVGVELARYRNAAGLTLTGAARLSGIPKPSVGHLESGRMQQDVDHISRLLTGYQAGQAEIDRLTALAARTDEATWWGRWASVVPDWFRIFLGVEGLAVDEFVFEPLIIPGLLQTEEYARAATDPSPWVPRAYAERYVTLRMARTSRLTDENRPLALHAVICEAALRLAVGTVATRQAQLRHLLDMSRRENVTIQILRPEDGLPGVTPVKFVLFGLGDTPSLAYVELPDGGLYVHDPEEVAAYMLAAAGVQRGALDAEASAELLASMIGD